MSRNLSGSKDHITICTLAFGWRKENILKIHLEKRKMELFFFLILNKICERNLIFICDILVNLNHFKNIHFFFKYCKLEQNRNCVHDKKIMPQKLQIGQCFKVSSRLLIPTLHFFSVMFISQISYLQCWQKVVHLHVRDSLLLLWFQYFVFLCYADCNTSLYCSET